MKKLAIVTTHPIQYNAPWFKLLTENGKVLPKVFYTWGQLQVEHKFDPGFGKGIQWDIPLLEGYEYSFIKNISNDPGSHHRNGIINPTLIVEIEAWQPDAVLIFGWNFKSHLECIRHFYKKIPVIFRGDSTLLDQVKGIKSLLRYIFLKWVYTHVDFALYVGTNNKNYFLKYGLKNKQLIFATHAIDNERFAEPNSLYHTQATILKEQLGIKPNDVVLLFAGKLENKKNPLYLIQLMKDQSNPKLKLLYVGNGSLENILKNIAFNDTRILFLDFKNQSQMPAIYRIADLVILPSKGPGETWGLSLNEAMASGVAVSATYKTGGAIDLIEEGVNGCLFDISNTNAINKIIENSLLSKNQLVRMGKESQKKINQFSFLKITNALEQLLATL